MAAPQPWHQAGRQVVVRLVAGFPTSPSLLALNDQRDRQRVLAGDA
jgi:hypothetical protein